jgi:hypothetical protein
VSVGEVSRSGCRLEGAHPLAIGAVGMLTIDIDGRRHVDLFRVSRSRALPGADPQYEAGVEFLPIPAEMASLHDLIAQLDRADPFDTM